MVSTLVVALVFAASSVHASQESTTLSDQASSLYTNVSGKLSDAYNSPKTDAVAKAGGLAAALYVVVQGTKCLINKATAKQTKAPVVGQSESNSSSFSFSSLIPSFLKPYSPRTKTRKLLEKKQDALKAKKDAHQVLAKDVTDIEKEVAAAQAELEKLEKEAKESKDAKHNEENNSSSSSASSSSSSSSKS